MPSFFFSGTPTASSNFTAKRKGKACKAAANEMQKNVVDHFCRNSLGKAVIHLETCNYTCKASLLARSTAMKGCTVGIAVTDSLLCSAIWFPFYVSCKDILMVFHHCNIQTAFSMRQKIKIKGGYPKALRKYFSFFIYAVI